MLTIPQIKQIEARDAYLGEALRRLVTAVNGLGKGIGVDAHGAVPSPGPIAALSVQAADGIFDIAITDTSEVRRGIFYFAESDTTPAFAAPTVYFLGASRNLRLYLGNLTLYWRAYSQYLGSEPSTPVAYGTPPAAVVGGGANGPAQQPSSGSGTAAPDEGGSGFGRLPRSRTGFFAT